VKQLGWYSDEDPGRVSFVRAGEIDLTLEVMDLRWLGLGSEELVRRVGVAVRDEWWGTIPAEITGLDLQRSERAFNLRFAASHRTGDLHFDWNGDVSGREDGTVRYSLDGICRSDFRYNRIGICVLHPLTFAGAAYSAVSPDGEVTGSLPHVVGPQAIENGVIYPLFPAFERLRLESRLLSVDFEFEGDLFETEDQRNWTDASFKTYSTPLSLGWPHQAHAGQRIAQQLTMRFDVPSPRPVRRPSSTAIEVILGDDTGRPLPPVGLGLSSDSSELGDAMESVRTTRPTHLRVDLDGTGGWWPRELERAQRDARALGAGLEVAAYLEKDFSLLDALAALPAEVIHRVLLMSPDGPLTHARLVAAARERLPTGVEISAGTDAHFAEINRGTSLPSGGDSLCYPITPQAHVTDTASIVETLEAQAHTVRKALLLGHLPVVVSPVTLRPRTPLVDPREGSRTPPDARQHSRFCAAWTLASIKQLSEAGASSLTYFETVGDRGVVPRGGGDAPVAHVLAEIATLRDGTLVASSSDAPLAVQTLAVRVAATIVVLVANLSPASRRVVVADGPAVDLGPWEVSRLESTGDGWSARSID
jgi:hypothetical protein